MRVHTVLTFGGFLRLIVVLSVGNVDGRMLPTVVTTMHGFPA